MLLTPGTAPAESFDRKAEALAAIPLARAIAREIWERLRPLFELDELTSIAMLGLTQAAASYDPSTHPPFQFYVRRRIRYALLDAIRREAWTYATNRETIHAIAQDELERRIAQLPGSHQHDETFAEAMAILTDEERKLFELIYVENMSVRQIAKQKFLNIGEKRAQKTHRKGLDKLRSEYKKAA